MRKKNFDDLELLTVEQVAKLWSVSTGVIYRWCRKNKLPFVRLPGYTGSGKKCLRIRRSDIEAYLENAGNDPEELRYQDMAQAAESVLPGVTAED